jgi:class 3 adenylate cyclase
VAGLPVGRQVLGADTAAGKAMLERRLLVTHDTRESELLDHKLFAKAGLLSHMSAPLVTGGEVIGTVNVSIDTPHAYDEDAQRLLTQVATILASNIQNRRLVSQLHEAWQKSESVLTNTLPPSIAQRMKDGARTIADSCDEVTVMFADIVGFTTMSAQLSAADLVNKLDAVFTEVDALATRHGVEKIKTIGDCYMIVSGAPEPRADHAHAAAAMALDLLELARRFELLPGTPLQMRIGLHAGPVVAGVIGRKRFAYDLWGDTVNTASRMESHGAPGRIHCSQQVNDLLKDAFEFEARGRVEIKGKGPMTTWYLTGRRERAE